MSDVGASPPDGSGRLRSQSRYSLRTPERPMAFTAWEFMGGAAVAWVLFLMVAPAIHLAVALVPGWFSQHDWLTLLPGTLVYSIAIALILTLTLFLPWSLGALLVLGVPLGIVLGLVLRGTRDRRIHLFAFAILGAAVALATTLVVHAVSEWGSGPLRAWAL